MSEDKWFGQCVVCKNWVRVFFLQNFDDCCSRECQNKKSEGKKVENDR